jgi:hypothetical protein
MGWKLMPTHDRIRFAPPLVIAKEDLLSAVEKLKLALEQLDTVCDTPTILKSSYTPLSYLRYQLDVIPGEDIDSQH